MNTQKLQIGAQAPRFLAKTHDGMTVDLSSYLGIGKRVLMIFYRYAKCPLCNHGFYHLMANYPMLKQHDVEIITIFESKPKDFPEYIGGKKMIPFPVISDPGKLLYNLYALDNKIRAVFHPVVLWRWIKALGARFKQPLIVDGDLGTIPAYFVLAEDGSIEHLRYGTHIADSIQVWEIQRLFKQRVG